MTEGVKTFLSSLGLSQYYDMFMAKGFDLESDVMHMNGEDLDSMYIVEETHRRQILSTAPRFQLSPEFALYEWLRQKGLDHYYINFVQSELTDLDTIGRLDLPNADLYDELELMLPGHRRRLERAVKQLVKKQKLSVPIKSTVTPEGRVGVSETMEVPVAYGRWGKPKCLEEAKYDFLMLEATVASTIDPTDKVDIDFMIDSGSDVVTIRQEVLDTLDLQLIGPIKSKGVHASKTKNLYKANIVIGNQILEIEVMGESYDSIGSRVIRNFRHYINGNRHVWLKGDFADPTLSSKEIRPSLGVCAASAESLPASTSRGQCSEEVVLTVSEETLDESSLLHSETEMEEPGSTSVEKDYSLIREPLEFADDKNDESENIDFKFSTKAENGEQANNELSKSDETDLLLMHNDEIIDVRPFIAANRKKYKKSGPVKFEVASDVAYKSHKIQVISPIQVVDNVGGSDTNTCNHFNDVTHSPMQTDVTDTLLSKRSVYYRSAKSTKSTNG